VSNCHTDVGLRPGTAGDYRFALALYLATMRPYTEELMVWDEVKQRNSFEALWQAESVRMVTFQRKVIGWLQVAENQTEVLLQQFFISPEYQGRGIGTVVLDRLLLEWDLRKKPIKLTVLKNNPARRLYERRGFVVVAEVGIKLEMMRRFSF
jgi:GNAT superfamily N-acetyltransferase